MVSVACFIGPIVIESVNATTPGHWVRGDEASYLRIFGVSEKIEFWCELKSVTCLMEDLGVQWDFLVCLEMFGSGGDDNVDAGFLLFAVSGFVGRRGLTEKELTVSSRNP